MSSKQIPVSPKTKVKRIPKRGVYDRDAIYAILDEAFICHVGFTVKDKPFVIPTSYARIGDRLVIHGSAASRMMRSLAQGIDVCVTVTILDGLVLARSAFHHSMNYRSVVIFGKATLVEGEDEKNEALKAFTEHIIPGRWPEIRWPSKKELKGTTVLILPIEEASAKVRSGPPIDDKEDYSMDVWAGVLPLSIIPGSGVTDPRLKPGIEVPHHVSKYKLGNLQG